MASTVNLKAFLFFYFSAMTIIIGYLPIYFQFNGLTGSQIGLLLAVGPLASIISQPFWGFITDKYKTSIKVIIICLVGAIISSILMFVTKTFTLLIITVFIFFSFMSPIGGLGDSLTQKYASRLSISFGTIRMWGSLGFAIMSLVAGLLLSQVGVQYVYVPFLFFIIVTLLIVFRVEDVATSKKAISFKEALTLFENKRFMLFLLFMMLLTITHRTNDSFLGIYIIEKGGTESFIGWAWFIGVVSEAFMFATATIWFRKFHALTFIIIAGFLFAVRWFIMGQIENPLFILPLQLMHGLTFGVFYLTAFHFVTKIVPEQLQSTGHLLFYSFFFGLSGVIGSSIGGFIIDQQSATDLYSVLAIIAVTGSFIMVFYRYVYFKSMGISSS